MAAVVVSEVVHLVHRHVACKDKDSCTRITHRHLSSLCAGLASGHLAAVGVDGCWRLVTAHPLDTIPSMLDTCCTDLNVHNIIRQCS